MIYCLRAITRCGRIILLELFLLFEQPTAESQQFAIREGKRTAGFGTVSQVLD
jgi:translation elongation factor EF-Tu-like GTPase